MNKLLTFALCLLTFLGGVAVGHFAWANPAVQHPAEQPAGERSGAGVAVAPVAPASLPGDPGPAKPDPVDTPTSPDEEANEAKRRTAQMALQFGKELNELNSFLGDVKKRLSSAKDENKELAALLTDALEKLKKSNDENSNLRTNIESLKGEQVQMRKKHASALSAMAAGHRETFNALMKNYDALKSRRFVVSLHEKTGYQGVKWAFGEFSVEPELGSVLFYGCPNLDDSPIETQLGNRITQKHYLDPNFRMKHWGDAKSIRIEQVAN